MFVESEIFFETFANGLLAADIPTLDSNCRKSFAYDLKGTGSSKDEELEAATALGNHFAEVTRRLLKAAKKKRPTFFVGAVQNSMVYYTGLVFADELFHDEEFLAYLDELGAHYFIKPSRDNWFGFEISIEVTPVLREALVLLDREKQKKVKANENDLPDTES